MQKRKANEKSYPRKTKRPTIQGQGHTNSMQTPPYALAPLYPYLPKSKVIWESAAGNFNLVRELNRKGYVVTSSDLITGQDFLQYQPDKWDIQVTNPPYDIKTKWIARSYSLKKPFALLLPYTALETPARQSLFDTYGVEIIFMNKRISFETPNGGSSSWFPTAWFTWGLNIGKQISFYEYIESDFEYKTS